MYVWGLDSYWDITGYFTIFCILLKEQFKLPLSLPRAWGDIFKFSLNPALKPQKYSVYYHIRQIKSLKYSHLWSWNNPIAWYFCLKVKQSPDTWLSNCFSCNHIYSNHLSIYIHAVYLTITRVGFLFSKQLMF